MARRNFMPLALQLQQRRNIAQRLNPFDWPLRDAFIYRWIKKLRNERLTKENT